MKPPIYILFLFLNHYFTFFFLFLLKLEENHTRMRPVKILLNSIVLLSSAVFAQEAEPTTDGLSNPPGVTGNVHYANLMNVSLWFYEEQRSGKLPSTNRVSWYVINFLFTFFFLGKKGKNSPFSVACRTLWCKFVITRFLISSSFFSPKAFRLCFKRWK